MKKVQLITKHEQSHMEEVVKDPMPKESRTKAYAESCISPIDMHTNELPNSDLHAIQDLCVMVMEKVSLEHDELSDDQEVYIQSRSENINSQYPELFVEYKDS